MRMQDTLVARADAVVPAIALARPANDRGEDLGNAFPPGAKAVIHCPAPSVVSSARPRRPSGCWSSSRARHYLSSR
jgi:hypothetical protein